jgi:hypothetical protein
MHRMVRSVMFFAIALWRLPAMFCRWDSRALECTLLREGDCRCAVALYLADLSERAGIWCISSALLFCANVAPETALHDAGVRELSSRGSPSAGSGE